MNDARQNRLSASQGSSRGKRQSRHRPSGTKVALSPALAVFARAPVPGKTKTRLIPALGPDGAAEFHRAVVSDTLRKVSKLKGNWARYLFVAGGRVPGEMRLDGLECHRQKGSDLGERMEQAFSALFHSHSSVIVIGTDSPSISPSTFRVAREELLVTDAVLGPCPDGGYYLIGLRKTHRGLFDGVRLGTSFAFRDTLDTLLTHGYSCSVLEPCPDIDLPRDLAALKKILTATPAARRLMPQTWRFLSKTI